MTPKEWSEALKSEKVDRHIRVEQLISLANSSEDQRLKLGKDGRCTELNVHVSRAIATNNTRGASELFQLMAITSKDLENEQDKLNRQAFRSSCKIFVDALKQTMHTGEAIYVVPILEFMAYLARDDDNRTELGHHGACQAVIQALKQFGQTNAAVAQYGCLAVRNLASNSADNRTELGRQGACQAVVLERF